MKNQGKTRQQSKNKNPATKSLGSTKATSSLISPGFLSQELIESKDKKSKLKNNISKIPKKNSLYDLQRTLDINIEILKNFFQSTTSAMTLLNQDKQILDKLDKFLAKYKRKKEIINKIKEIKSKNLIQSQIFFENKRKLQETLNNCKESLMDNEDAVNNKDEYVKLFQKKFVEVEIYLQRITSDMEDLRRKKYYQNYKMDNFTNLNTILCKKKRNLNKEIDKYKIAKQNLKMENKKILKEEKNIIVQEKKREKEREKDEEEIKRKNEMIEKKYKIYIKAKISKLNILKNFMNNNCNIDKLLNNDFKKNRININEIKNSNISNSNEDKNKKKIVMFKKVAPKKNQNGERDINIIREEDENEKSILPFDMTKRISSFMDFSTILNDNSRIKESTNNRQKNVSRIIWGDVSAIEKNDDFL
jgi:hypothetical protein